MKMLQIVALGSALGSPLLAQPAAGQTRFATLYNFTNGYPVGLAGADGVLYGLSAGLGPTGSNCGTVFELQPPAAIGGAWTETVLHSFAATYNDGCNPTYAPVVGAKGALYGLTDIWGAYLSGAMYKLQPPASPGGTWTETVLYNFGAPGAGVWEAVSNLVAGGDSSFYVLASGGIYGSAALVQLRPPAAHGGTWTGTVLYSFPSGSPPGTLAMDAHGVFYGSTLYSNGGPGLIFQLAPPAAPGGSWTETVLYTLASGEGATPNSLIVASDGTLYGTTYGTSQFGIGAGTVFQVAPPASPGGNWTYTMLKNFGVNHPDQPLILRNGNLYSAIATAQGGLIFELQHPSTPGGAWTTIILHDFTNGQVPGAAISGGALVMTKNGTIYGATQNVNARPPNGTVYRITPK